MTHHLDSEELAALIDRVFKPGREDQALAVLVDLPDAHTPDNAAWRQRREMAAGWVEQLTTASRRLDLEIHLVLYANARRDNADLPATAWIHGGGALPASAAELSEGHGVPFSGIFSSHRILLAPTEFSATAPLKLAAKEFGIRAATMPGFSRDMIPALRLDYREINRRVNHLKSLLDRACRAELLFRTDRRDGHRLTIDLRHRTAHASGGLFHEPGVAGNLPSGEAYIVPYEGEHRGDGSRTSGELPVQFGNELVVYTVVHNRATQANGSGRAAVEERERLVQEPAYGNLAELGLGVLGDFGVQPCGEVLLDEKLGLHIAFGRSDHFGGQVGAAQFTKPEAVVHIDRVYLPSTQPRVEVVSADLLMEDQSRVALMRDGVYAIDFGRLQG